MAETTTSRKLLNGEFMAKLDQLDVMSRKILSGKLQGERRSKKRGQSVEFADYRQYVMGDDLRFIDWNLYARLDKLFLRLFMEEEDLSVSVLIDCSASMEYGDPSKMHYARQIAAALGYIGLVNYNRVSLFGFTTDLTYRQMNLRGRRPIPQMLEFLSTLPAASTGNVEQSLKQFALLQKQKGVVIVISDLLEKGDLSTAFRYLMGDRFDTYVIQVLSPQEVDPEKGNVIGDLRLRDLEDGNVAEVSVGPALMKRYRAVLQAYCEHIKQACARRGVAYLMSETSVPFDVLVLQYLRRRGLLA